MATIEERARSHAGASINPHFTYNEDYVLATRYASYKEGAAEQKAIDIEKAKKWFMTYCKNSGSCDREWMCSFCPRLEALKKAMEE